MEGIQGVGSGAPSVPVQPQGGPAPAGSSRGPVPEAAEPGRSEYRRDGRRERTAPAGRSLPTAATSLTAASPGWPPALPRTESLGGPRAGVFRRSADNLDPRAQLEAAAQEFPGSNSFLWYKEFSTDPALLDGMFAAARARGIVPQIGWEPTGLTLGDLNRALAGEGQLPPGGQNERLNQVYLDVVRWARTLRDKGPVYLRPMSEMNDASAPWQLGRRDAGNTPQQFAEAWCRLHRVFDREGAANVLFLFDVMSGSATPLRGDRIRQTLRLIPPSYIDALGIHPYARAQRRGAPPIPFADLVAPWMRLFQNTGHGATPVVIGEMGVSGNPFLPSNPHRNDPDVLRPGTRAYDAWDVRRARWIREAFAFARSRGIALVTYFDQLNTNWRVDPGTRAHRALGEAIAGFGR